MDFTKVNRFKSVKWTKKTDGFSFKKLKDLTDEGVRQFKIYGLFFTNGEYGKQAVAIAEDCLVNLPTHSVDTVAELLNDNEAVDAIDRGECTIAIRPYMNKKFKRECYDIEFMNTMN